MRRTAWAICSWLIKEYEIVDSISVLDAAYQVNQVLSLSLFATVAPCRTNNHYHYRGGRALRAVSSASSCLIGLYRQTPQSLLHQSLIPSPNTISSGSLCCSRYQMLCIAPRKVEIFPDVSPEIHFRTGRTVLPCVSDVCTFAAALLIVTLRFGLGWVFRVNVDNSPKQRSVIREFLFSDHSPAIPLCGEVRKLLQFTTSLSAPGLQQYDEGSRGHVESVMEQYSPAWFKAEMKRKGWSRRDLALRWGKTETWISKITNNPQRDQYWNDAIVGLPDKKKR